MIENVLKNIAINLDRIDEKAKETFLALLNIIEAQAKEITDLRRQLQELKDEINRLKGEQGKPTIKANTNNKDHEDISSEKERKKPKKAHKKRKKNKTIKINRTEKCRIDKSKLPADAKFKGYHEVIVQGLKIERIMFYLKKRSTILHLSKRTISQIYPAPSGTMKAVLNQ